MPSPRLYQPRPGGSWYGWFYVKGHRIRRCTKTRDRRTAEAILRRWEREAAGAAEIPQSLDTVQVAFDDLVDHGLSDVAASTKDYYEAKAGLVTTRLGDVVLSDLTLDDVQGYIHERLEADKVKPLSVAKELTALRLALKLAKRRGRWRGELADVIPTFRARYQPRTRHLSPEDYRRLLAKLPAHRRLWLTVACYTGARASELRGLMWGHIDLAGGWVTLPGTKTARAARKVPISPALGKALADAKPGRPEALLFPVKGNLHRSLRRACAALGLDPVSPNDLRRTYASWLVSAGVSTYVAARLLGHSSTRMVEAVYGHLADGALLAAAGALPLPQGHRKAPQKRAKKRNRR
jgi:integrase